jgi:hypothetical protein
MLLEPETWVALAFVVFMAGLGYIGVHRMIGKSLDDRAGRIKAELDEARKLKDEAAQLLADYQRKRQEAESEAQEIVAGARAEADGSPQASQMRSSRAAPGWPDQDRQAEGANTADARRRRYNRAPRKFSPKKPRASSATN